jgi:hypothetical protein
MVVTDGKGGLVVQVSYLGQVDPIVREIEEFHENVHIKQALAEKPDIAKDQPAGRTLGDNDDLSLAEKEIEANVATLEKIAEMKGDKKYTPDQQKTIAKQEENQKRLLERNQKNAEQERKRRREEKPKPKPKK